MPGSPADETRFSTKRNVDFMPTKILVVDDESSVRHLLQVMLTTEGYQPLLAANGAEALQMAHEHLPSLILLDWMMPILDGIATLQALRIDPVTAEVPVVMLTARQGDSDLAQAMVQGADFYITKPFEAEEMLAVIRRFVRNGQPAQASP
jgi:DNA-binding response OmpR family regulator